MEEDVLFEELLELKEKIDYHNDLFFNANTSEISDSEFDLLKLRYDTIIENNPDLEEKINGLEPGDETVIYERRSDLKVIKHNRPFTSPRRTYDFTTYENVKKRIGGGIYIETKLDGIGIELIYKKGKLCNIVTKGSITEGEDINHNIALFKSIPKEINALKDVPITDIRIEAYLEFDDIKDIQERTSTIIQKPRNQLSGWLRSDHPNKVAKDHVNIAAYDMDERTRTALGIETGKQLRKWFTDNKFGIPDLVLEKDFFNQVKSKKAPSDGFMVKANKFSIRKELYSTDEGVLAFKFNTLFGISNIKDIVWKTNKSEITPTLVYEEVLIDGSSCSKANGFNAGKVKELNLGIGDKIRIVMAGDIVPHLDEIIFRTDSERFKIPTECPCCHGPVSLIGPTLVCNDRSDCGGYVVGLLKRAVSAEGLNLKGIGEETIREWVGEGLIKTPSDLYKLTNEDIGMRYYAIINDGRKQTLSSFIYALGIEEIGIGTCEDISHHCVNIEGFFDFVKSPDKIKKFLSPSKAMYFLQAFDSKSKIHQAECFAAALTIRPDTFSKGYPKVVLTGTFSLHRNAFAELLMRSNIEVVVRVTKEVKCVIVGWRPEETNAMKVAKKLGIPVYEFNDAVDINEIVRKING